MSNVTRAEQSTAVPPSSANVYEVLLRRAAAHPSATALGSQQGLTWHSADSAELLARVDQLAVELAREGVGEVIPLDTSSRLASILPLSHLFELVCGIAMAHAPPDVRAPADEVAAVEGLPAIGQRMRQAWGV